MAVVCETYMYQYVKYILDIYEDITRSICNSKQVKQIIKSNKE
jgi:hypothetical protein